MATPAPSATSINSQQFLIEFLEKNQMENFKYLADHPEIAAIVRLIIKLTIKKKPKNCQEMLVKYFSQPVWMLERDVNYEMEQSNRDKFMDDISDTWSS